MDTFKATHRLECSFLVTVGPCPAYSRTIAHTITERVEEVTFPDGSGYYRNADREVVGSFPSCDEPRIVVGIKPAWKSAPILVRAVSL